MNVSVDNIYMDYASATPMDPSVLKVFSKISRGNYANASAIHAIGEKSRVILENSRTEISKILGTHNDEIIFTSGATESNNLAILGLLEEHLNFFSHCALPGVPGGTLADKKNQDVPFAGIPHIITTNIEHPSVLEVCRYLEENGKAEVTYIPVEISGIVDPKKIKKAIKSNTILISVMYANNEIGTIQPIREIAKEVRHYKKTNNQTFPILHTDATQAINYLPINIEKLGVDLMSFNAGKIYGPKGVGILVKRRNIQLSPIIHGGEQERGFRSGTENLAGIVGLAESLKIVEILKEKEVVRLTKLRDYFIERLLQIGIENEIKIRLNGDKGERLPNNINISIAKIPSDLILIELSTRGIYVSEKSACKSGDKKASHVIKAINNPKICKKESSLRFSFGRQTEKKDIDFTLKQFSIILKKLKKWYD